MPSSARLVAGALVSVVITGAASAACDSFGTSDDPAVGGDGGGGAESGAANDGAVTGSSEGGPDGSRTTLDGGCQTSSTGSHFQQLVPKVVVSSGSDLDYPFGIVTDETNVYWVSQYAPLGATTAKTAAYNGHGTARIHRAPKLGERVDPGTTILATDQKETLGLALEGDFLYWAVKIDAATMELRRIPRTCSGPCMIEPWMRPTWVSPVARLVPGPSGILVSLHVDGSVYVIDLARKSATLKTSVGAYGSLTGRGDRVFASADGNPNVVDVLAPANRPVFATFPFATPAGGSPIATNCSDLFAFRSSDRALWLASATHEGGFSFHADLDQTEVYDLFADRDHVYAASANGGLSVVDIATKAKRSQVSGSYWQITADESGVYAGDHAENAPGAIHRFSD